MHRNADNLTILYTFKCNNLYGGLFAWLLQDFWHHQIEVLVILWNDFWLHDLCHSSTSVWQNVVRVVILGYHLYSGILALCLQDESSLDMLSTNCQLVWHQREVTVSCDTYLEKATMSMIKILTNHEFEVKWHIIICFKDVDNFLVLKISRVVWRKRWCYIFTCACTHFNYAYAWRG